MLCHIWQKPNTTYQRKHLVPAAEHSTANYDLLCILKYSRVKYEVICQAAWPKLRMKVLQRFSQNLDLNPN